MVCVIWHVLCSLNTTIGKAVLVLDVPQISANTKLLTKLSTLRIFVPISIDTTLIMMGPLWWLWLAAYSQKRKIVYSSSTSKAQDCVPLKHKKRRIVYLWGDRERSKWKSSWPHRLWAQTCSPKLSNKIGRGQILSRNIGNTNVVRVVSGHILHADFIYAIGLWCMSSCEEVFAF